MTIRPLFGSALGLAAALAVAPAASAQQVQSGLPQGVVLNPGERLVTPGRVPAAPAAPRYVGPQTVTPGVQYAAPQYAAPRYTTSTVVPRSSGVVTVGGVQPAGTVRYAAPATAYRPAPQPTTAYRPAQTSMVGGSDQARAQAEANMMASRNIRGHVGGTIGAFEGVGWSSSGTPNTCTPSRPMRLTADAIARGPGGVYRVRAWR